MLAALTRNWGIFLMIPLVYEYLSQIHFNFRRISAALIWLLFIPAGLVGYMVYLHLKFDKPLAFITVQSHWKRSFTYPWEAFAITLQNIRRDSHFGNNLLDLIFTITCLGLILTGVSKIRVPYQIYAVIGLLIPLWAATPWAGLLSMPRSVLVLFPIFITLAIFVRNQETKTAILAFFAGLLAFFSVLFAQAYWIA
jgi:hypothetical protein